MPSSNTFTAEQLATVNTAVSLAEELVSDFFKMSASQWLHPKYDVKTQTQLAPEEVVEGPFAQIIRYEGKRTDSSLGSASYDFYKICLQDAAVLTAVDKRPELELFPFTLYIVTHELVHIVRFSKFLQNFDASPEEKMAEESRVHGITHDILKGERIPGMPAVLRFYAEWRRPLEGFTT